MYKRKQSCRIFFLGVDEIDSKRKIVMRDRHSGCVINRDGKLHGGGYYMIKKTKICRYKIETMKENKI